MAKILLSSYDVAECSKLPQGHTYALDLTPYNITNADAEEFFNILKLVPLLETAPDYTRHALLEVIRKAISHPTDKRDNYLRFSTFIGCNKMHVLLATYFWTTSDVSYCIFY